MVTFTIARDAMRALVLTVTCLLGAALPGGAAPADGLLFYQDFDHAGRALCGGGWATDQPVPAGSLVPGRFGKACRFERPRTNILSANQASAEAGTAGFAPGEGAKLTAAPVETSFGKQALRAEVAGPGPAWATAPVAAKVAAPHRPAKVFLFSAYLRAGRPGVKVRLSLADRNEESAWRAPIEAANKAALEKDAKAKVTPPVETVSEPGTVTLGTAWLRVAARLEVDARRPEQSLVGSLEVLDGAPATLFADGLQLEQACVYPLSDTDPTSWIPGGEKRGPAWIDLAARETGFAGGRGTLGCWVRPLPDQCGGTRSVLAAVTLGTGWWTPVWQIGGSQWYVGEAPTKQPKGKLPGGAAEKALFEKGGHDGWHLLTLAWDETEAVGYLDGKPFGRTPLAPGKPVHGTVLRLGGSFLEHVTMSGDLDEVFLYDRRFSDAEVEALAAARDPLSASLPRILVRRPVRTAFLRSEAAAAIALEVVPYGGAPAEATVTARIPDLKASVTAKVAPGKAAALPLRPWLREPGESVLLVDAAAGGNRVSARDAVAVFEEPATPEFIIYAWGGEDRDLEERGFNCLFGEPRSLLERGMWAIARIDVREGVPHPWSPETRARARVAAERVARAAMAHPNVRACLVNSEAYHPPFPDEPWFREWMKREAGLDHIPPEVVRDPVHARPQPDAEPPAVLPADYPAYRFLRWWTERGQGYYVLNNQMVRWMRQAGLRTVYYTDQPETPSQFEAMDLADFWDYPKAPEGLEASFSRACNIARLAGKPFQAMPGTVYWDDGNGLWVTDTDGKRKVLCLSPDCLKENLWISVACPTVSIGLYGIGERRTGVYDPACDAAMTEAYRLIRPVGVLVGGLPREQPKVAVLETEGLNFIQPGVGDNWVRHWLTRSAGRYLARTRLPFDWITDDHAAAGWLGRYQAVFVPGAWCLPEATHRALVAYAKAGGKVIADKVMRAEIPGMHRLGIETQAYPDEEVERELGGWARAYREAHPGWARVRPVEDVIAYTREAGKSRYLFLINDRREPGPQYERWKITLNALGKKPAEPLRDRGLPQDVRVNVPAGPVLYDVLAHRRLETERKGDRQEMTVHLDPGGAAVIAALPVAVGRLDLQVPARIAPGTAAEARLRVLDAGGKPILDGRQMAEVRVLDPEGKEWAGVQRYRRIAGGSLVVPLRLPLTAKRGEWRVEVLEWVSGKRAAGRFAY